MQRREMDTAAVEAARAVLMWAARPGSHGGTNPYGQAHVIAAERLLAEHEGREVAAFAARYEGGAE
jgi:hypothetical protein